MPTLQGRTEFDVVEETQLYYQERLNVKSMGSEDWDSLSESCPRQAEAQTSLAQIIDIGESELLEKVIQPAMFLTTAQDLTRIGAESGSLPERVDTLIRVANQ